MRAGGLDQWRSYFRTAAISDIFEIIEQAIAVAASDCPNELRSRRDRIAELLFSCQLGRCSHLVVPESSDNHCNSQNNDAGVDGDDEYVDIEGDDDDIGTGQYEVEMVGGSSKESNVTSNNRDCDEKVNLDEEKQKQQQMVSNYSYGEAEALTDEIEEVSQVVGEVFRIKDILLNCRDESDSVLYESLRRLQLMALTVDTLKATEIGKAVNILRKHGSEEIRDLARMLIDGWKDLVDEWYSATQAIRGDKGTPESINPSTIDDDEEEGLPSPPLDEGAFFTTQPTGMELSQFFDGMDDDGNPRNSGEFNKNHENGRKPSLDSQNSTRRKPQPPNSSSTLAKDNKSQQLKREVALVKPNKPSIPISGSSRPFKQNAEHMIKHDHKLQQKVEKVTSQRKPLGSQQEKLKCSDEVAVQRKLEATKRKLQESYQQAEKAKKQRTIQVMELHDLPKQGLVNKNHYMRPGYFNRQRAQGRR